MTVLAMSASVSSSSSLLVSAAPCVRPRVSARDEPPSSGGRSNSQSSRPEKRAPSSMATALPRRLPRTRAPATRRTGPRRRHVALERAGDRDRLGLDGLARDAAALGDGEVAADGEIALDVALDDEVAVAVDAAANAGAAADACADSLPPLRVVVRACAMIGARS